MRNSKLAKFGLAAIASLMVILPGRTWAGGEELRTDGKDSKSVVDLGTFSPSPFRFSVSVRGGYDDNVNTTHIDEEGSAFINIGGTLAYNFGSPRTQLSLTAGGGLDLLFERCQN